MKYLSTISVAVALCVPALAQTQNISGTNQLSINYVGDGAVGPITLGIPFGGDASMVYHGIPNAPILLVISGGVQPSSYVFGPNNRVDVSLANLAVLLDGTGIFVPSALAPYLSTGSNGVMNFIIPHAVTLPGQHFAVQGAFVSPTLPAGIQVSAAFNVFAPNLQPGTPGCHTGSLPVPGAGDSTSTLIDLTPSNGPNWFTFYGVSYSQLYAGSDGHLTASYYTDYIESVTGFLQSTARICPLWDDLNCSAPTSLTYYVNDTPGSEVFELCWTNVPEYPFVGQNSFKITLTPFSITFDYGAISALDGLVGLSPGATGSPGNWTPIATALPLDLSTVGIGVAMNQGTTLQAPYELFAGPIQNDLAGKRITWVLGLSGGGVLGTPISVH